MYAFTFERPASLADAVKLAGAGGKPLAGGQTLRLVSSGKSTPRRDAWSSGSSAASSGNSFVVSPMKCSLNWMMRQRSGMLQPFGTSLTQLCGRFGPVSTRLPGWNSPMKSPTK